MKILQIRFANLNSLAGGWTIDLTGPEYVADGLFAITGPTGAGKSTILDAVCLALYGRTPRLKQVSKSTNEIMTRHSGECWSEVEFSTSKGRYRCHWSQHRARRSATGELQPPRHEIVNCANDRPLETKIKLVAQKVVEVTGMSYEQFTRSILLAQGDFNTFLKAPPDERAPILEQITGTDIYSRISRKVHERRGEELIQFEQLSRECDGFIPLTQEQLALLTTQLEELGGKAGRMQGRINHDRDLLEWYMARERLQRESDLLGEKLTELNRTWLELEPERQRLARADKAKALAPHHLRLVEEENMQEKEKGELADASRVLAQRIKDLEETADNEKKARDELEKVKQEAREQEIVLRQVRQLDQQLLMVDKQCTEIAEQLTAELSRKKETENTINSLTSKTATLVQHLQGLEQYRTSHAADRALVDEYSGLKEQSGQYLDMADHQKSLTSKLPNLREQLAHIGGLVDAKKAETATLFIRQAAFEQREADIVKELNTLLGEITLEGLYEKDSRLQQKIHLLDQAQELAGRYLRIEKELAALAVRKDAGRTQQQKYTGLCRELAGQLLLQQRNVEKQQEIVRLVEKMRSYEEVRQSLRDNEPCPLCGSLSHPYVSSGFNSDEDKELSRLHDEISRLEQLREQLTASRSALAATEKEDELIEQNLSRGFLEKKEIRHALAALAGQLGLPFDANLTQELDKLRPDLANEQKRLLDLRKEVEKLNKQLEKVAHDKNSLAKENTSSERELQKLLHEQEKITTLMQQQTEELELLNRAMDAKQAALAKRLAPYTTQAVTADNCSEILTALESRRATWLESETNHQLLTTQLQGYRGEQASQQLLLTNQLATCKAKEQQLAQLRLVYQDLLHQRTSLFGDKHPEEAEKQMHTRLEKIEQQSTSLANLLNRLREEHAALTASQTTLSQRINERHSYLETLKQNFTSALLLAGFTDRESFLSSRLQEDEHLQLLEEIEKLQKAVEETKALIQATTIKMFAEKSKNLTDIPREDIEARVAGLQEEFSVIQQEIGALRQQVQHNERQQQLHREKLALLSSRKAELARWSRLHELIGSNDGKKFRNFAQGLTFEIMISHANTSLTKMSDRYLLIRDPLQPLELHVIDNYQGGEVRSTKNLSGGESFIVSMALALGLSTMASHNVQVDSLFLDEGFGTLDEESLQTALDTLAGLHQEGKIIGVISHVSGLRERIGTQIRVTPGIGGISRLSGPGIARRREALDG